MRGKDSKLVEVRMERDLFGCILFLALQQKIDMGEVLKYPLTPIPPLSLCHVDGSMLKTTKVALLTDLEKRVQCNDPPSVDVLIIDGMFFLHLMHDLPATLEL